MRGPNSNWGSDPEDVGGMVGMSLKEMGEEHASGWIGWGKFLRRGDVVCREPVR